MQESITATEAIRLRRSVRNFKNHPQVSEKQIRLLLEAAMMAPSACNTRPWKFIVVRNREKLDTLAALHPHAKMLTTVSLAIIVCALPEMQKNTSFGFFPQDCAAATQNILLQAVALGLGSCWCGVYPKENRISEVRSVLDLVNREDIIPFNIIAIGVADDFPEARGFYEEDKVSYM